MHNQKALVINWHLTEACNYACDYCYAAWNKPEKKRELIHNLERTKALLLELYRFFYLEKENNPLATEMRWDKVRLNIAGGEPLLFGDKVLDLVDMANDIGFEVSMITNGSFLNQQTLERLAPNLVWLGISLDSSNAITNQQIGRTTRKGEQLNLPALINSLNRVRAVNPAMRLKINTVVNAANYDEDFHSLINHLYPEKWKVLRMLPVVNSNLSVNDQQFAEFVARHRDIKSACIEDNQDMRDSYLMIDPHGRFFQNSMQGAGQGYLYSQSIVEVGAHNAFDEVSFNSERFASRYEKIPAVLV